MPAINSTDLNNAKLDVDHIAAIATSPGPTATDRFGGVKQTMRGATDAIATKVAAVEATKNNAIANAIPAAIAAVDASKNNALTVLIPAAVALVDTAVMLTAAGQATAAKVAAEAARDAAMVAGKVYATAPAGISATSSGQYFSTPSPDSPESLILYLNSAGTAVEQKRYPSAAAVAAIPVSNSETEGMDAEVLVDLTGNIMRRTDEAGDMYLPGVAAGSVQAAIKRAEGAVFDGAGALKDDMIEVSDAKGRVVFRQDVYGGVHIPGVPGSIQEALGYGLARVNTSRPTARDALNPAIKGYVKELLAEGYDFIPPPALLVPNNMHVPNGIVSAFTCAPDPVPQDLPTPYGMGGTVHPFLIEMRRPMLGYKYIMGETPHKQSNAWEENPYLLGSNDLRNWNLIDGLEQPLGYPILGRGSYNSDVNLTYDPRIGELICCWRESIQGYVNMHYSGTRNGRDWSPEVIQRTPNFISQAYLFNPSDNLWHVFTPGGNGFQHWTSTDILGTWKLVGEANTQILIGSAVWHMEVKFMGDKYVALVEKNDIGSQIWLGISSDGNNWTFGPGLLSPRIDYVYKPTFLPQFDGNMLRLAIAFNTYRYPPNAATLQQFHLTYTNWVDVTTL